MNSNTLNITIEVDDKGTPKIKILGKEMGVAAKKGDEGFKRTNKSLGDFNGTVSGTTKLVAGLATGFVALKLYQLVKETIALADSWTLLDNKLKLVTDSERELAVVQTELYELSLRSHAAYSTSVDLYSRFARATKSLGTSQSELLRITETLNKATLISGATQQETAASMQQLSQAFASGVLRGDEFRSVTEQSARVTQILADHLGVSIGKLREMAFDGQITADVMLEAFSGAAATIDAEFSEMQVSVSQAMTDLSTVWASVIHDANETSGATNDIATSVQGLADTIDNNREGIVGFFVTIVEGAGLAVKAVGFVGNAIEGVQMLAMAAKFGDSWQEEWAKINATGKEKLQNELTDLQTQLDAVGASYARGSLTAAGYTSESARLKQEILKTLIELDKLLGFQDAAGTSTDALTGSTDGLSGAINRATLSWQKLAQAQVAGQQVGATDMFMGLDDANERAEGIIKAQEKVTDASQILAAKQAEAYRDMYDDMAHSAEEDFTNRLGLLDKQKESYLKILVEENKDHKDALKNSLLIERWHAEQVEDLLDKRLLKTGDFFDGMRLGYEQLLDDQLTWAEAGKDVFLTFAEEGKDALKSNLFDVLKGDFDDLGQVWGALWDSMLAKLVDILVEMAASWAAAKVADMAAAYIFHEGTMDAGGDYKGQGMLAHDEIPAVLQQGEIVIPQTQSQRIRDSLNGDTSISGNAFDGIAAAVEGTIDSSENASMDGFGQGFVDSLGDKLGVAATRGSLSVASGISVKNTIDAMTSPVAVTSMVAASIQEALEEELGLDPNAQKAGAVVRGGTTAASVSFAGAMAGVVGAIAGFATTLGVDGLMDLANVRDMETLKDELEDNLGHFAGREAFKDFRKAVEQQAKDVANTIGNPKDQATAPGGPDSYGGGGYESANSDVGMNDDGSDMGLGDGVGTMAARYGGIFSGPDQGYPIELHGTEAVIPLKNGTVPVELRGADKKGEETVAIIAAINGLRADLRAGNYQIAKNTGQMSRTIKRWDSAGMPEERVVVQ